MQPKDFREAAHEGVEQNIGRWIRDPQSGRLPMLNQLSEPRIVDVAAKIAGFDVAVPEAGNQNQSGDYGYPHPVVSDESRSRWQRASFHRRFDGRFQFSVRGGDQHIGAIQINKPLQILSLNKHTTLSRPSDEEGSEV